jgi:cytochrome P450
VTVSDVTIPEGDQVLLLYGSANHDETVFENPDKLDITRKGARPHYSFGHGIHYCLGNAVARLQTRVALQELVAALGEWDVDEAGVVRNQLVPGRGIAHVPVTFEPADPGAPAPAAG